MNYLQQLHVLFSGMFTLLLLGGVTDLVSTEKRQMTELCANAIDDDNDGLVDLNDPDCVCEVVEPESLIPNPSFEDLNCCPNSRSQLNCAEVWIQASTPTTDLIHQCGWGGWPDYAPPQPFPDGEGVLGFRDGRPSFMMDEPNPNWKEYAGACLLSPLVAGNRYRFEFEVGFVDRIFSPPINVTFFGTSDCGNLPFGGSDDRFGCPTNGPDWFRLGSTMVNGGAGNQWVNAAIEVEPSVDIEAIAIGPDCPEILAEVGLYYYFDDLILDDFESFTFKITGTVHPCSDAYRLTVPDRENTTFQWYYEGVAILGETNPGLNRRPVDGQYAVVIDDGTGCRTSPVFEYREPVLEVASTVVICPEETYFFGGLQIGTSGNYLDTFRSVNNCDSIVPLELTVLGETLDTVDVKLFEGESYEIGTFDIQKEGEYFVTLSSILDCDSLVFVRLDYYDVYFPTAFSPNDDGINDSFTVQGGEDLVEVLELRVFDRWGNLLSSDSSWDGRRAGEPLNPGVYVYQARLLMDDGKERDFSGAVALLR
ncbi:MAG: gliding motility-associated C-terminal domain-containing protein [Lewinella sp.]